jgi:hypothetical protein
MVFNSSYVVLAPHKSCNSKIASAENPCNFKYFTNYDLIKFWESTIKDKTNEPTRKICEIFAVTRIFGAFHFAVI